MKISESSSYPHPVLAPWSSDIGDANFHVDLVLRENGEAQEIDIHCEATLDQPDIRALIESGDAAFGCFVTCVATGFRRLQPFGFPSGQHQFAPGALLGRVQLRPMVWAVRPISGYTPAGAHIEFGGAHDIQAGQILALDEEQKVDVLRPPLPTIESIFELISSTELGNGDFEVDLSGDRIRIITGEGTYAQIQALRQTNEATRTVVMNALFAPAVMEVLHRLAEGQEQYSQHRWFDPFSRRCELLDVELDSPNLLADAQRLLEKPFDRLACLTEDTEAADV